MVEGQVPTISILNITSAGILPGYFTKPSDLRERGGEREREEEEKEEEKEKEKAEGEERGMKKGMGKGK